MLVLVRGRKLARAANLRPEAQKAHLYDAQYIIAEEAIGCRARVLYDGCNWHCGFVVSCCPVSITCHRNFVFFPRVFHVGSVLDKVCFMSVVSDAMSGGGRCSGMLTSHAACQMSVDPSVVGGRVVCKGWHVYAYANTPACVS